MNHSVSNRHHILSIQLGINFDNFACITEYAGAASYVEIIWAWVAWADAVDGCYCIWGHIFS